MAFPHGIFAWQRAAVRKVQASEFTVKLARGIVVSPRSRNEVVMRAEVKAMPLDGYTNLPRDTVPVGHNATEKTIASANSVCAVLGACGQTEIAPAVIQAVAVHVIDVDAGRRIEDEAMEVDFFAPVERAMLRVESTALVGARMPFLQRNAVVVLVIDKGDLAAREFDFTHATPANQNRRGTAPLFPADRRQGKEGHIPWRLAQSCRRPLG